MKYSELSGRESRGWVLWVQRTQPRDPCVSSHHEDDKGKQNPGLAVQSRERGKQKERRRPAVLRRKAAPRLGVQGTSGWASGPASRSSSSQPGPGRSSPAPPGRAWKAGPFCPRHPASTFASAWLFPFESKASLSRPPLCSLPGPNRLKFKCRQSPNPVRPRAGMGGPPSVLPSEGAELRGCDGRAGFQTASRPALTLGAARVAPGLLVGPGFPPGAPCLCLALLLSLQRKLRPVRRCHPVCLSGASGTYLLDRGCPGLSSKCA